MNQYTRKTIVAYNKDGLVETGPISEKGSHLGYKIELGKGSHVLGLLGTFTLTPLPPHQTPTPLGMVF